MSDAYHSLSIEGYRVSPELIERVRRGSWIRMRTSRTASSVMRSRQEAMACLSGRAEKHPQGPQRREPRGRSESGSRHWYREMFAPSVTAGFLRPADLAGYRNAPVYIRRSMHVPPNREAVSDAMPVFFAWCA